MTGHYWIRLQDSIAEHWKQPFPRIGWLVAILVALVVLYILLALVLIPGGASREFNFSNERGSVTALSAIFLAAGSAFVSFFILHHNIDQRWFLWLLITIALGFLSLDELLEFHERVGIYLDRDEFTARMLPDIFRLWNDVIIIVYGIVSITLLFYYLPAILRYPMLAEMFAVAFLFYIVHTAIDVTQEPPTAGSYIFEESAKLFSSMFLALGPFVGLISIIWSRSRDTLKHT